MHCISGLICAQWFLGFLLTRLGFYGLHSSLWSDVVLYFKWNWDTPADLMRPFTCWDSPCGLWCHVKSYPCDILKKNGLSQFASLHRVHLRPTSFLFIFHACCFPKCPQIISIITLSALPLFLALTAFFNSCCLKFTLCYMYPSCFQQV